MKALIVGAGAVGQVYGRHLQRGGAEVSFFVREAYAEAARAGFTLYALNGAHKTTPVPLIPDGVLTTMDEVAAGTWDQVWITVSSTALRGPWLPELLARIGRAIVVSLQPGLDDRALLTAHVPEERVVSGLIALIAYQAPLPGERRFAGPGIAYWFPPFAGSPFTGAAATQAADALVRGGQRASVRASLSDAVLANALLSASVLALESVGWSWTRALADDTLDLAARAGMQALAAGAAQTGAPVPWWTRGVGRTAFRIGMSLSKAAIPLDIETYLRVHFTKVADQTRLHAARYRELAVAHGLPHDALDTLMARVDAAPASGLDGAGAGV